MGNITHNIRNHVIDEFNKVKEEPERDFLMVDEAMKLEGLDGMKINPRLLAVLFAMDRDRDGRFTLDDVLGFAEWAGAVTQGCRDGDVEQEVHAHCTLFLYREAIASQGRDQFVNWFSELMAESGETVILESYPGRSFLPQDSAASMHTALAIQESFGIDVQAFFDLLQRVGEERGLLRLDDENLDEVVPVEVVDEFSGQFIDGFVAMMERVIGSSH
eukprot:gb/GECH01002265.1/.p1 GENE.gb/GECH01002265.1/~~gb/GECH01002265.1/.p1  ORF type:complete len:217 (+),score=56.87 gb/GECH01002265.1/:1-651(+)